MTAPVVVGVDDSGHVPLRQPEAGGAALGQIVAGAAPVPVLDVTGAAPLALRDVHSRVLNLDAHSPGSLIARLTDALAPAVPGPARVLGPADVALQMIKSPEALLVAAPAAAMRKGSVEDA